VNAGFAWATWPGLDPQAIPSGRLTRIQPRLMRHAGLIWPCIGSDKEGQPMTTMTSEKKSKTTTPEIEPRQVREAAGLSQTEMAALMGMSLNGYQLWEQGARRPGGPARRLLQLIAADPKMVIATLK